MPEIEIKEIDKDKFKEKEKGLFMSNSILK